MDRNCCPILLWTSRPRRPLGLRWLTSVCICPGLSGLSSSVIVLLPPPSGWCLPLPLRDDQRLEPQRVPPLWELFLTAHVGGRYPRDLDGGFLAEITSRSAIPAIFAPLCPGFD